MPNWSPDIPQDPRGHALPLLRTPAARPLAAIVTSNDLVGCDTHFWGGHTVPCDGAECDACQHGAAYRWHAYLSAYNPDDQLHFIFECTANAASAFASYRTEHGSLRCCAFTAYRWRKTRNGRVIIRCERSGIAPAALPKAPDLTQVMAVIWRLPLPNVFQAGAQRDHPRIHADPDGNGESPDPRDYVKSNP